MKSRSRFVLPLTAALLLGAVLALRFFWSAPELEPSPAGGSPSVEAPTAQALVSAPPLASPAAAPAEPVKAEGPPRLAEGPATVVPVGPGDEVPEPEVESAPAQRNEPIVPEEPQTAAWKREKTVRITELLDRDVERLVGELRAAESRGDEAEAKRLKVQIARHRARLARLSDETAE